MENDFNQMNFEKMGLYYKIMIIGDENVGKTQILRRLCNEEFDENYSPTFCMDFRIQKVYDEKSKLTVKVQIVEVSGKFLPPMDILKEYIIDTDCFICVYDISRKESVEKLNDIIEGYESIMSDSNNRTKRQSWYFVGNKCDLKDRKVPDNPFGTRQFLEVSAKDNRYIDKMFNNCVFHESNIKMWKMNNDAMESKNKI